MTLVGEKYTSKSFGPGHSAAVIMRRDIPPETMVFYPHPEQLATSPAPYPARLRWRFALSAVLHQVRQRLCSWSLIRERAFRRQRFLFLVRCSLASPLGLEADLELEKLDIANSLIPADYHFLAYRSLEPSTLPTFFPPSPSSTGPGHFHGPPLSSQWDMSTPTIPPLRLNEEAEVPRGVIPPRVTTVAITPEDSSGEAPVRPQSPYNPRAPDSGLPSPTSSTVIQEGRSDLALAPSESSRGVSALLHSPPSRRSPSPELPLILASPTVPRTSTFPGSPSPSQDLSRLSLHDDKELSMPAPLLPLLPLALESSPNAARSGCRAVSQPSGGQEGDKSSSEVGGEGNVVHALRDELATVKARLIHLEGLLEALLQTSGKAASEITIRISAVDDDTCSVRTVVDS